MKEVRKARYHRTLLLKMLRSLKWLFMRTSRFICLGCRIYRAPSYISLSYALLIARWYITKTMHALQREDPPSLGINVSGQGGKIIIFYCFSAGAIWAEAILAKFMRRKQDEAFNFTASCCSKSVLEINTPCSHRIIHFNHDPIVFK